MYRLLITKRTGVTFKHYYFNYDNLEYDRSFCKFGQNVRTVVGQKLTLFGWKTLFTDVTVQL